MIQSGGKLPYTGNLDDTHARRKQKSSLVFKKRDLISADLNILSLLGILSTRHHLTEFAIEAFLKHLQKRFKCLWGCK
jgi:hypothetical protein